MYEDLCQSVRGGTPRIADVRKHGAPPMPQVVTIRSLPKAFEFVKAMQADGLRTVRVGDQPAIKANLHAIINATTVPRARSAARRFADRWTADYRRAVACLRNDLDELLTCWRYKSLTVRKAVRTTNAIERRFREVRRRTRPMGVFSDRTSMERILFAVFNHQNQK